jgi:hypothetical protein
MVEAAIRDCIDFLQQGRRKEAEDQLFEAAAVLSEKSGTWDEMHRMYAAANDPKLTPGG